MGTFTLKKETRFKRSMASDELASFLAKGNTMPGGFASVLPAMDVSATEDDEENPLGRNTLKLREQSIVSSGQGRPYGCRDDAWCITPDMMKQPWGTVLRALQPRSTATINSNRARQ